MKPLFKLVCIPEYIFEHPELLSSHDSTRQLGSDDVKNEVKAFMTFNVTPN
jgi:hypothetical protein